MGKATTRETTECLCGVCGQTPKSGRFMQGHDQKLRTILEEKVGGLEALKGIVEALEQYANGDLSERTVRRILEKLEELESILAFDEAKASGDETIPLEQAALEIEQGRQ